jgi:hypothetical protein
VAECDSILTARPLSASVGPTVSKLICHPTSDVSERARITASWPEQTRDSAHQGETNFMGPGFTKAPRTF